MCCSGSNSSNDAETFDDGSFTAFDSHKCSELNFRRLGDKCDFLVVVIVLPLLTYVDDDFNDDDLLAELDEDAVLVDSSPTQRTECIVVVISPERSVRRVSRLLRVNALRVVLHV